MVNQNQEGESTEERIGETTALEATSTQRPNLSVHTEERDTVERNWFATAESSIELGTEDRNKNASRITTDFNSRTSPQEPSFAALSKTDNHSGLQSVFSSESKRNAAVMTSTVAHESDAASQTTSPLSISKDDDGGMTSAHGIVVEESTAGRLSTEPSEPVTSVKMTSGAFSTHIESSSDGTVAVTVNSQSHSVSTDRTMTTNSERSTNILSSDSYADVTRELTKGISDATTTSDVSTASEVESVSHERSDSSYLHLDVSEEVSRTQNATTSSSLSSRAMYSESHLSSEQLHTSGQTVVGRPTPTRTPRKTDTPSPADDTEPARRTPQLTSKAAGGDDHFRTTSESSSGSGSSLKDSDSSSGPFVGLAVGVTVAVVILLLVVIIIVVVVYRRRRQQTCYITDHDLKDYRKLMKRPHEPTTALTSPSVAQPTSPFSDAFPQDVTRNGLPASNMINFDRNSDDGLDGIEIVHDSRGQSSPKEIPTEEYNLNPSGYSDCSYSVNTFRPPPRNNEAQKSAGLTQSEAETKFSSAVESSGNDEKTIVE